MRTIIILTLGLAAMLPAAASAQTPRIRTSAPASMTAQKQGEAAAPTAAETPAAPAARAKAPKSRPALTDRFMAVKTNVAYDAVAVLNAAFELQLTPHVTLDVPVMWSLWDCKPDLGLRIVAVQPEARYWFGSPGRGSAVGVSVGLASYNFRHDDIRYQNVSGRPLVAASLSYTYVLPLADRWSAEFSLAVGYANARYNRYYNIDNGALINIRTRNYFGPTKVGITLSYRLGK